jgi:hypothetical protein
VEQTGYYAVTWRLKSLIVLLDFFLLGIAFAFLATLAESATRFVTDWLHIPGDSIWKDAEASIRRDVPALFSLLGLIGAFYCVIAINRRLMRKWFRQTHS